MYRSEERHEARAAARRFEEALTADSRKRLGQFFTGVPLGKILAHVALTANTRSVLDPMAGHGDLLDAAAEAARERGLDLERLDGIEIDSTTAQFCRERLARTADLAAGVNILTGSAFDPAAIATLPAAGYDLVITNPPYVRYQAGGADGGPAAGARRGLSAIVDHRVSNDERAVWQALVCGYSGLADLSVPSWLLAALMVRPGGTLALVVPATWRSRNYGDVIRYFMLRCCTMRCVIEDTQPGWFSDALVRTHLIIATRLPPDEAAVPLRRRADAGHAPWLAISPGAADKNSLVGAAFGDQPEAQLAAFIAAGGSNPPPGMKVTAFDARAEWGAIQAKTQQRSWYQELEGDSHDLPLFASPHSSNEAPLPEAVRDLAGGLSLAPLTPLEQTGIHVGQGLRTGSNRFFYVDACGIDPAGMIRVRVSAAFGAREFSVPTDALRPVLRKQAELPEVEMGRVPPGRVLDLRRWCLPEDSAAVAEARATYRRQGEPTPAIMPDELAAFVRKAAQIAPAGEGGKLTPELSAVRTNIRPHRSGSATPRFWYMLPDFMPRHLPAAFVPRIIDGAPWVERNLDEPILIDANFSTFWTADRLWTSNGLKALLNSTWCRLMMEAMGTPMGGGALKLEATHLRLLPLPAFTDDSRHALDEAGRSLGSDGDGIARADEIVMAALSSGSRPGDLTSAMAERGERLRDMRRRRAA